MYTIRNDVTSLFLHKQIQLMYVSHVLQSKLLRAVTERLDKKTK